MVSREIEAGRGAIEPVSGLVIGSSRLLGGVEGAEPKAGTAVGFTDLGDPFAPRPLPHTSIRASRVLWSTLPPHAPLPRLPHSPFHARALLNALLRLHLLSSLRHSGSSVSVGLKEEVEDDDDDGGGKSGTSWPRGGGRGYFKTVVGVIGC